MAPNVPGMTAITQPRLIRPKRVRPYSGRGEVYAWLRAHYTQVGRLITGGQHPWAAIIAEMAALM
jgi:hypothetical protein